jgi:hypothetical protein
MHKVTGQFGMIKATNATSVFVHWLSNSSWNDEFTEVILGKSANNSGRACTRDEA